jgi:hypothetical protein
LRLDKGHQRRSANEDHTSEEADEEKKAQQTWHDRGQSL